MNWKALFPRASQAFVDLNSGLPNPESKRALRHEPLAKNKRKAKSPGRTVVRYTSYRLRLLDIDNLAGGTKFLTDALRYIGAIENDSEDDICLQIAQKKVGCKAHEKTLIEVIYP